MKESFTLYEIIEAYLSGLYEGQDDAWYRDHAENNNLPDPGSWGDVQLKRFLEKLEKEKSP